MKSKRKQNRAKSGTERKMAEGKIQRQLYSKGNTTPAK